MVGFCSVDVVPSPKSHRYVSVSPSGSAAVAVKAIGFPTRTLPVGLREALTVGGWLVACANAVAAIDRHKPTPATSASNARVRPMTLPLNPELGYWCN